MNDFDDFDAMTDETWASYDEPDDTPFLTEDYDFHNEQSAMEDAAMEWGLFGDC